MTSSRRRARPFRLLLLGAASAVATTAALVAAPLAATADTGSTVSGTVAYTVAGGGTNTSNTSTVRLYPLTGSSPQQPLVVQASAGTWSFAGVAPGRYRVQFGPTPDGVDAGTWLGSDLEDSATVVVVGSAAVTVPLTTQPLAGSISGTVTGASGSAGFAAYRWNDQTRMFERLNNLPAQFNGSTYTFGGLSAGKYVVRFADSVSDLAPQFSTDYYNNTPSVWSSTFVTVAAGQNVSGIDGTVGPWQWYTGRMAGSDRFETSVAISKAFYPNPGQANVVYVANGVNFPDALSASAAAAHDGGPLLMTRQDGVPASVVAEIQRLAPPTIVVIGGTAAVSAAAYQQLAALAPSIQRISGSDRFETSRSVASHSFSSAHPTSVFIATGTNFPDALVAGSAAGYENSPLVLVDGRAGALDSATKSLLTTLAPSRIYVVGGVNSVSTGIQNELGTLGVPVVLRLAGGDRFGTAQAVNKEVFPFADQAFIASGLGFPDALSISALAGVVGAPLLLAPTTCIPYGEANDATVQGVATYFVVGGTSVLTPAVEQLQLCAQGEYGTSSGLTTSSARVAPKIGSLTPGQSGLDAAIRSAHAKR